MPIFFEILTIFSSSVKARFQSYIGLSRKSAIHTQHIELGPLGKLKIILLQLAGEDVTSPLWKRV